MGSLFYPVAYFSKPLFVKMSPSFSMRDFLLVIVCLDSYFCLLWCYFGTTVHWIWSSARGNLLLPLSPSILPSPCLVSPKGKSCFGCFSSCLPCVLVVNRANSHPLQSLCGSPHLKGPPLSYFSLQIQFIFEA